MLIPIKVKASFYRVGIDIKRLLPIISNNNHYIIIAMDYFTKQSETKPLSRAIVKITSDFIYNEIIYQHGYLKYLLSDRNTYFNNRIIEELIKNFKIKHLFFSPITLKQMDQ